MRATFLQEQLDAQKVKLEDSEKQVIEYAQKEGIVDVDNKQPQVLAELQTVQNAYSNAVTTRLSLEETWQQAQADDGNSLPQVMADGLFRASGRSLHNCGRLSGQTHNAQARVPGNDRSAKSRSMKRKRTFARKSCA